MKNILLIGTGGTIASSYGLNGLKPIHSCDFLTNSIPELKQICNISTLELLALDSTNMMPEHWRHIAITIEVNFSSFDAFVITHGTDTMAYTAAALSYMIQNSGKPIVITGSQRPMESQFTDARKNLGDAISFATRSNAGGVFIVFDGEVINGCRAVKMRTKSDNAFESINCPSIANVIDSDIVFNNIYNTNECNSRKSPENVVDFNANMSTDVFLLKLMPGLKPATFDFIKKNFKGVVIETFGTGGIPSLGKGNMLSKIEELTNAGLIVVIATQCLLEGSNLNIYEVGKKIMSLPIIPAYDMTSEAAVVKLMWVLGQTEDFEIAKKLFLKPVQNDMTLEEVV